jgi:predicted XRE-type DNA-binding protein
MFYHLQLFEILHIYALSSIIAVPAVISHRPAMLSQNAEAPEEIEMRAVLTGALEAWLRDSGLTQTAAAAVLGTTQARVSEIKHGKTRQFSLDLLVRLAARASLQPRISLTSTR